MNRQCINEWTRWGIGWMLAGLIAYFTTIGTMRAEISRVQEREENHFQEVLRRLEVLQYDIRELRNAGKAGS